MSSSKSLIVQIKSLSKELSNKVLSSSIKTDDNDTTTASTVAAVDCLELLQSLESITTTTTKTTSTKTTTTKTTTANTNNEIKKTKMTIVILNETKIGVTLNKLLKSFRRFNRSDNDGCKHWKECIDISQRMLSSWKDTVKEEREKGSTTYEDNDVNSNKDDDDDDGNKKAKLPTSVTNYRSRLVLHKKEMYKDPPALPPSSIVIESTYCPLPKRDKKSGELSFVLSTEQQKSQKMKEYIKDFKPNRTPEEIMRAGSFGGTYFRPIVSSVTNVRYVPSNVLKETVESEWIANLDKKTMLTSSTYNASVNKYKVKCGGSLGMWESSGWIADSDPYGWFQWYCRFYRGRRCNDDERQISRWLKSAGPKGRFRSQLCNKIIGQGGISQINNVSISPVIRQTLLHWGLEITEDVLRKHGKRVGAKL